ncbi:hypothetical protein K438DRAFT_2008166 [Mycena galopus ATCC 62051]|nr:hypothetical protein K438DRAFT_2008166 [Mycena galopus ATCC 62051]
MIRCQIGDGQENHNDNGGDDDDPQEDSAVEAKSSYDGLVIAAARSEDPPAHVDEEDRRGEGPTALQGDLCWLFLLFVSFLVNFADDRSSVSTPETLEPVVDIVRHRSASQTISVLLERSDDFTWIVPLFTFTTIRVVHPAAAPHSLAKLGAVAYLSRMNIVEAEQEILHTPAMEREPPLAPPTKHPPPYRHPLPPASGANRNPCQDGLVAEV